MWSVVIRWTMYRKSGIIDTSVLGCHDTASCSNRAWHGWVIGFETPISLGFWGFLYISCKLTVYHITFLIPLIKLIVICEFCYNL